MVWMCSTYMTDKEDNCTHCDPKIWSEQTIWQAQTQVVVYIKMTIRKKKSCLIMCSELICVIQAPAACYQLKNTIYSNKFYRKKICIAFKRKQRPPRNQNKKKNRTKIKDTEKQNSNISLKIIQNFE